MPTSENVYLEHIYSVSLEEEREREVEIRRAYRERERVAKECHRVVIGLFRSLIRVSSFFVSYFMSPFIFPWLSSIGNPSMRKSVEYSSTS